jgi:hypothetical protein
MPEINALSAAIVAGRFTENQTDVGRSLNKDNDRRAKRTVPKVQGDRGDQRR